MLVSAGRLSLCESMRRLQASWPWTTRVLPVARTSARRNSKASHPAVSVCSVMKGTWKLLVPPARAANGMIWSLACRSMGAPLSSSASSWRATWAPTRSAGRCDAPGPVGAEPGSADEVSEQGERGPGLRGSAVAELLDLGADPGRAEDRGGGGGHPGRDVPVIQVGCQGNSPDPCGCLAAAGVSGRSDRPHAGTAKRRMPCPAGGYAGRIISIPAARPISVSMRTITCRRWSADGAKVLEQAAAELASAPRPQNVRTGSTDTASVVGEPAMPMSQAYRPAGSAFPARTRRTGIPPRLRRGSRPPGRVSPGSPAGAGTQARALALGPGIADPDRLAGQRGVGGGVPHDGAAAGVKRSVDVNHVRRWPPAPAHGPQPDPGSAPGRRTPPRAPVSGHAAR